MPHLLKKSRLIKGTSVAFYPVKKKSGRAAGRAEQKKALAARRKNSRSGASLNESFDEAQDFAKNCTNNRHKNFYRNFFVASRRHTS
ncbi:hypothetical protein [Kalamiella sp. sgz302252]|uniref:hypothetical protein n=1 Tax=Pantoea sp. sgz302252 TaxID=3341827 RepID=UPI0036D39871